MNLRVAVVLGTTAGGTGRHAAMLSGACADAGALVRVFGPASARALWPADSAQRSPLSPIGFDAVTITDRPRPVRDARAVLRLRRLLVAMRPDVVHAHGLRAGAFAALALWLGAPSSARRGGWRAALVVTVHNAPPSQPRLAAIYGVLERVVARRADVVLCVSPDLSDRMRGLGASNVRRAVVAAPELASVPADQVRAELGDHRRPVVLGVGRLAPQKGFGTLLAAAAMWRGRQPVPLVVIAGSGPLADDLARQARELKVDALFLGARADVAALLAAADVFVLPSRWEGQPLILAEALRAGRPIVAAKVGGIADLTGDDAAVLVPANDPAALSRAVLAVLDDPELAGRLAAAASDRAACLPTAADAAAAVLRLYGEIGPPSGLGGEQR
ncbi:MAG TPA: glycosyltransferase family 4 protein [Streptosporangiaceae bacterium]|nr:glycosyltransferase family 4 protein [Streptosporangiaceae bacterium]